MEVSVPRGVPGQPELWGREGSGCRVGRTAREVCVNYDD